jgi:uracil-DNA glycosylase
MRNLRVVVPLGGTAALYLLSARHITRTRGILHEFERGGKTLIGIPTFHPSHVDRTGGINGPNFPLLVKDLKMALKEASDA